MRSSALGLVCPHCHTALGESGPDAACTGCGRPMPQRGGWRDLASEIPPQEGIAQAFMEAPAVVFVYERLFRPAFTRLGSSMTYAQEERWLGEAFTPVDGPVLDIACGTGRYARLLAERVGPDRVVGLDLSVAMLDGAAQTNARGEGSITYVRASAQALPFADATVGAVNCFGALHLFPDPAKALAETARVLRAGGSFTCLTAVQRPGGVRATVQRAFAKAATFRFFEEDWLRDELQRHGMTRTRFEHHGMLLLFRAQR